MAYARSISIPEALAEAVKGAAPDRPFNAVVREALQEWVNRQKKKRR